jgi:thiosulfate/3-mercaptopyruvate sulfurtransferase
MYTPLISVEQLKALQASGQPLMVFDCSFDLMKPEAGAAMYQQAHIAGAVHADLNQHLSAHLPAHPEPVEGGAQASTRPAATGMPASGGRHPLPSREDFGAWLASVGFANPMQAVVYDRQGANYCGRLWWMIKWAGHEAVAVLDGGLQAWQAAQGAVATGPDGPRSAARFTLAPEKAALATTQDVAEQLGRPGQTLLDARATARFRGEVEPLDPVAGHIPGALNRPFAQNIAADGKFKPAGQLKAEFLELLAGCDPASVVHHCGSGVSAVPNLIAMEIAGLGRTPLYAGSWSEWCGDPTLPVAKG